MPIHPAPNAMLLVWKHSAVAWESLCREVGKLVLTVERGRSCRLDPCSAGSDASPDATRGYEDSITVGLGAVHSKRMTSVSGKRTFAVPGVALGVDDDERNPLSRACRHLLASGEVRSHLVAVLFKGPSGYPRWLGLFAETRAGDVLFFPGFLESYKFVLGRGQDASQSFGGPVDLDYLALDHTLEAWSMNAAGGTARQEMPRPTRVGRKQVLWFGMTANVARLFRVARSDTRLNLTVPKETGAAATLKAALDGTAVEMLTFDGDPVPDQHAAHFGVFVCDGDAPAYSGPTLGTPDRASPFVRMNPKPGDFHIAAKGHSFRLATRTVQVVTAWFPVEVTTGITFTCPTTSIERARPWSFVRTTLAGLVNVLRARRGRVPAMHREALPVGPPEAPPPRSEQMHVWVKPASVQLPLRSSPFRFAVGRPDAASSNSWVITVEKRGDVYVACRDNFREVKVSLHASGRWRLALTEQAVKARPDLLPPGADRVWDRWAPPPDHETRLVIAFQVAFPSGELYVRQEQRTGWKPMVFVEPSSDPDKMVVVSTCVVPSLAPVQPPPDGTPFGVLAAIPIDERRSVQLVATYEASAPFEQVRNDAMEAQKRRFGVVPGTIPDDAVMVLWGAKPDGARWLTAARVWPYG